MVETALNSLRYRPNNTNPEENKGGYIVYDGGATDYHQCVFRCEIKMEAADEKDKKKTMAHIIESLRGNATDVARDMDRSKLLDPDGKGLPLLIDNMSKMIFPLRAEEAKALYREGHKVGGMLSRQHLESMVSMLLGESAGGSY